MAKKKKKVTTKRKPLDLGLPVYQLKITLEDSHPAIWRRIHTADCTLAGLHDIIQCVFDWEEAHPHVFEVGDEQYSSGESLDCDVMGDFEEGADVLLSHLAEDELRSFVYEYDFGDSWRHVIEIEETLPAAPGVRYPVCVDGARAAPPEDCGGVWGFAEKLSMLKELNRSEREELQEWIPPDFDPEAFSVEQVNRWLAPLRRTLGQERNDRLGKHQIKPGQLVRIKPGVVHHEYTDLALGGWEATVVEPLWLVPLAYEVRWTERTLAACHPVYHKRCRRDDVPVDEYLADEIELVAAAADEPLALEPPTGLTTRPLSADDTEDQVRAIFGLTSDDPLPEIDLETQQTYFAYLRERMRFPFSAWYSCAENGWSGEMVEVLGFAEPPVDEVEGVRCRCRRKGADFDVPLLHLALDSDDDVGKLVATYDYWIMDAQDRKEWAEGDEETDDDSGIYDADDEWDEDDEEDDLDEDDAESLFPGVRLSTTPVYPVGTIAFYGPDDRTTTKIAAGVIAAEGAEPILKRWVGTDVLTSRKVQRELASFLEEHGVASVSMSDGNMGCPHEEGEDFPVGEDCPFCPWWKGKQGSQAEE